MVIGDAVCRDKFSDVLPSCKACDASNTAFLCVLVILSRPCITLELIDSGVPTVATLVDNNTVQIFDTISAVSYAKNSFQVYFAII